MIGAFFLSRKKAPKVSFAWLRELVVPVPVIPGALRRALFAAHLGKSIQKIRCACTNFSIPYLTLG